MEIKVKKLHPDAILPKYALPGDAGMDLYAVEETIVEPGKIVPVPTGIAIELPEGYVSLVWDKSSIPLRYGITTMGGVIEHTYRGEYRIIMHNSSTVPHTFERGDKIAQLLIQPIVSAQIVEVGELSESLRGQGGFGSTGVK
ncbi:MAG: dUTP diphosphatase [Patescibacteria group bacterium]|jgi:dUTP pyrophosphatase